MDMHGYLHRRAELAIDRALGRSPAVALLGPRQCGKSTLARHCLTDRNAVYLDLQYRPHRARLDEPELYLEQHRGQLVCLDEIQVLPEFFSVLRSEIDQDRRPGRFLILGSASRDLMRQSTESLAGRIAYLDLTPFVLGEVSPAVSRATLWSRGGFPESVLAADDADSLAWRLDFIRTFLERDLAALGVRAPVTEMQRLWRLLAHYHGQTLNYSKLAGAADLTVQTLKRYLSLLEQTYMIRLLPPFETNLKKRLVRSPKLYIRDSGLVHALLDIEDHDSLLAHPANGASWEGFVVEHALAYMPGWRGSFLRTSNGAEVDLVMERGGALRVLECKLSKAPRPSRGFHQLCDELQPQAAAVVAPVDAPYQHTQGLWVADVAHLEALWPA
jgi:uncharacterized protein